MKRLLAFFCAGILLLGLAACGGDDSGTPEPPGNSLPAAITHPPCRADGECGISSAP